VVPAVRVILLSLQLTVLVEQAAVDMVVVERWIIVVQMVQLIQVVEVVDHLLNQELQVVQE
jgi:hypothetical protein